MAGRERDDSARRETDAGGPQIRHRWVAANDVKMNARVSARFDGAPRGRRADRENLGSKSLAALLERVERCVERAIGIERRHDDRQVDRGCHYNAPRPALGKGTARSPARAMRRLPTIG